MRGRIGYTLHPLNLTVGELRAQVLLALAQRDGGVSEETSALVTAQLGKNQLKHLLQRVKACVRPNAPLPKSRFSNSGEFMYPTGKIAERMQKKYKRIF